MNRAGELAGSPTWDAAWNPSTIPDLSGRPRAPFCRGLCSRLNAVSGDHASPRPANRLSDSGNSGSIRRRSWRKRHSCHECRWMRSWRREARSRGHSRTYRRKTGRGARGFAEHRRSSCDPGALPAEIGKGGSTGTGAFGHFSLGVPEPTTYWRHTLRSRQDCEVLGAQETPGRGFESRRSRH
jgi:hypothetical protein